MPLTAEQELPSRTEEPKTWTTKRLFPFTQVAKVLAKTFVSIFDVLLGFMILMIGIAEVSGRHISGIFYLLTFFILLANLVERRAPSTGEAKTP